MGASVTMEIKLISQEDRAAYKDKILAFFPESIRANKAAIYDNLVQYPSPDRMLFVAEEDGEVQGFSYVTAKPTVNGKFFQFDIMIGRLITGHEQFESFVTQIKAMGAIGIKFIGDRGIRRLARRYGFKEGMINNIPSGIIKLQD
jgi:hypothetical protein